MFSDLLPRSVYQIDTSVWLAVDNCEIRNKVYWWSTRFLNSTNIGTRIDPTKHIGFFRTLNVIKRRDQFDFFSNRVSYESLLE